MCVHTDRYANLLVSVSMMGWENEREVKVGRKVRARETQIKQSLTKMCVCVCARTNLIISSPSLPNVALFDEGGDRTRCARETTGRCGNVCFFFSARTRSCSTFWYRALQKIFVREKHVYENGE